MLGLPLQESQAVILWGRFMMCFMTAVSPAIGGALTSKLPIVLLSHGRRTVFIGQESTKFRALLPGTVLEVGLKPAAFLV